MEPVTNRMPVIFIAGPFRGEDHWEMVKHRYRAMAAGMRVAAEGGVPLIPHNNTCHFHGTITDEFWLLAYRELLSRCDAVYLIRGWQRSEGARAEKELAEILGIPVLTDYDELCAWLEKNKPVAT